MNHIKSFIEKENIFKEEAIKGCSFEEVNELKRSTNKEIPTIILDFLLDYGKSRHSALNLNEIYNRFLRQEQYTRLFKEMKMEYQDSDSFFEIEELDEREMLFFSWNGGGHGDYMMSFVYPISESNPIVYHYVEGELQNTEKQFSNYVFQSIVNSINNSVRRIEFNAEKIKEYQSRTQFLKIPNISNLKLEIDLKNSDVKIPDEIKNCDKISELAFKKGSHKEIEPILQKNKDCVVKISLIELNQFPEDFELPFGEELEVLSIWRFEPKNLIINPSKYPKLKTLVINNTKLKKLPKEIVEIDSLEYLQLMKAELTDIPRFLSNSKKLISLDFWGCQINRIPDYINEFQHLKFLNLSQNFIDKNEISIVKKTLPNTEIWVKNQLKK